ncbi:MAG: hypothetical protein LQ345_000950 [Seirophora villosa]|nr:MAG: hypothetical protein LQ345_000950 [Seirophora villosa]
MALRAAQNNHAAILELCIDEGAALSDLDLEDGTESDDILKVFITKGVLDVNKDQETGGDMLINAVWELKYNFTAWLLEHGSDPNSGHLMADSTSAITAAAERGRTDFSQLLVRYGAKVSRSGALADAKG